MIQHLDDFKIVFRLVRLYRIPSPALATRLSISSRTIMWTPPSLSILETRASNTLSVGHPVKGIGESPLLER